MIDIVLLALIGTSVLLGLMRGFVGIVVATLSWLLAGWAAFLFGNDAAHWWAAPVAPGTGHYVGGYLGVFLAVMIAVGGIGMLIKAAVKVTCLTGADRLLGGALGLVRGAFLGCVLLMLAAFTPLPDEAAWRDSQVRPLLQPGVRWMQAQLPEVALPEVNLPQLPPLELGKPLATGDNGVLGEVVAGRGWPRPVDEARDPVPADAAARGPASTLPTNIEPARARPDDTAPSRNGSPGQARPPSL
ncbi:CvpA family protein [Stenotrophomonas sp. GZD-301]|uniref:CvpA family protein n=1 Tax=Stenotrophomonas sp. GZD-301 TaxID=3404814 RepID=UPI003BB68EA5